VRTTYAPPRPWSNQTLRQDFEHWIVGSPFTVANNQTQVLMVSLVRQASYTSADLNMRAEEPLCIYQVQPYALATNRLLRAATQPNSSRVRRLTSEAPMP
jgi:hypothetical protein